MKKILLFLFALVTMATHSQTPGDIAQSFGESPGFSGGINSIAVQLDGKILVGGYFFSYRGAAKNRIVRLNTDGTVDTAFNTETGFNGTVFSIAVQPDGKILVGGDFTTYKGVAENKIIRLNTDGTKDTSFNTGTGFDSVVYSIAVQSDGKILAGGDFSTYKGVAENKIIRLSTNGTKDAAFTTGTGFNTYVLSIAVQSDGKILVGGNFTTYKGAAENYIIRLNTNGTNDTAFNNGTGFNSNVRSIAVQPDGKILVGGDFTNYKGVTENYIIRLNTNGTKDTAFTTGTGFDSEVNSIALQPDGKILVGGGFFTYNGTAENRIIRLNTNGTKDTAFTTGTGFNSIVYSIAVQSDGKILVGGAFTTYRGTAENYIIRLNTGGTKDAAFTTGTGFSDTVFSIAVQPDGKILVGGNFTTYKGATENRIIRLNTDGTKDITFTTGTGFNDIVYSIAVQPDGKILVGGDFTTYNGAAENRIIRLNSDGTKDTTFTTGTGFNAKVNAIAVQPDGKILVGGNFTTYKGTAENYIIRLNTNGTNDTAFNNGTGFNSNVYSIAVQPDGKILVGGIFITYNGANENFIIRLNTNGTNDTAFNNGSGFNGKVYSIALQPDGKILVGGFFTTYNGANENFIIRLNTDGTKDVAFTTGTGFSDNVNAIAVQSDGKILVGGFFTSYNGTTENKIICLNTDGTKNTAFNTGTGFFDSNVLSIAVQPNGKILVCGYFTTYKGSNESAYLIGLHTEQSLSTTSFDAAIAFVIYPNPVQDVLHLQANNFTSIKAVKIYDLQGKVVLEDTNDTINVSNLSKGLYIVKISTEEGEFTKKFIKE